MPIMTTAVTSPSAYMPAPAVMPVVMDQNR